MRAPADIPGLDAGLLERYPAATLWALGERLGIEDARAGARAGAEYIAFALTRLGREVELTPDERHAFVVGLVAGLDAGLRVLAMH